MLRQICFVSLLLFVQHCEAQLACAVDAECKVPLYKPHKCTAAYTKCECAEGLAANTEGDRCDLTAPTIKDENAGKAYYTNVDYNLECITTARDVTFKWYKETVEVPGATSRTYTIREPQEASEIKYKCEITIGTGAEKRMASSMEGKVTFVAPGKVCDADAKCTGPELSGKCDLTNTKRCVCAANYVVKEDTCSKNGAPVVSTSLLLFVVAIFSQLMKLF